MTVRKPRRISLAGLATGLLLGWGLPAQATTIEEFEAVKKSALQLTLAKPPGLTPLEELALIEIAYNDYKKQQKDAGVMAIGQPALDGQFPVSTLFPGITGLLTFQFIDPATELPTAGPTIGSVFYEVNVDPFSDVFSPLGTSFDAATNFSFPFTVPSGLEPDIHATPFDPAGDPIIIVGVGGENVAVGSVVNIPIPEPSTLFLFGQGLLVVLSASAVRRRQRNGDR